MKITISSENYISKQEAQLAIGVDKYARKLYSSTNRVINSLRWIEKTCDPYDFFTYCVNGYVWNQGLYYTALSNHVSFNGKIKRVNKKGNYYLDPFYYKPRIKPKQRTNEFMKQFASHDFWCGSQVMFVDVDGDNNTIENYIVSCKYKPTFAYYSYTDGKGGLRRFRLVYCLSRIITDVREWDIISTLIRYWCPGNTDPTSTNPTQTSFGTCNTGIWFGNILDTDREFGNILERQEQELTYIIEKTEKIKPDYPHLKITFDTKLINILSSDLKWSDLNKTFFIPDIYRKFYWRKESEVIERHIIQGYTIGLATENYWQLDLNPNYIIKDGEGRRMKLRTRAMIRRVLNPSLSAEQILVNMYYDRERLIDNSDGIVNLAEMCNLVQNVFKYEIGTLEKLLERISYVQNLKAIKHDIIILDPPKSIEKFEEIRLQYVDDYIINRLYNPGISENQNLININAELERIHVNLRIKSRDRLIDFRNRKNVVKTLNKTRDEFIIEKYNEGLSLSQIVDELDIYGYKHMSREGIRKVIKKK